MKNLLVFLMTVFLVGSQVWDYWRERGFDRHLVGLLLAGGVLVVAVKELLDLIAKGVGQ